MAEPESTTQVESTPIPPAHTAEYRQWRMTGEIPTKTAEPSPATTPEAKKPEPKAEKPSEGEGKEAKAAASEPAKVEPIETKRAKTERRFNELLEERKADRKQLAAMEKEISELKAARKTAEVVTAPAAESPKPKEEPKAPEKTVSTLADKIAAINAKDSEFKTYEEKILAIAEAVADDRVERIKAEAEARSKEAESKTKQTEAEKQLQERKTRWDASVEEAKKLHADFIEVTKPLTMNSGIPSGSIVEATILESEVGTEIMYYLAQHSDELTAILKMNPLAQARALFKIEEPLLAKSSPAAKETKSEATPPEPKKKPEAPPPPRELGSGATAPKDELEAAIKEKNFARFKAEHNRRVIEEARARKV